MESDTKPLYINNDYGIGMELQQPLFRYFHDLDTFSSERENIVVPKLDLEAKKLKWRFQNGNKYRFKKGHIPWSKGKDWINKATIQKYKPLVDLYLTGNYTQRELMKKGYKCQRHGFKKVGIHLYGDKFKEMAKFQSSEMYKRSRIKIDIPSEDDPNLAWILGVLCGDGYISKNTIGLNVTEENFANKFQNIMNKIFNIEINTYTSIKGEKYPNNKPLICKRIHSINLSNFLSKFGLFKTKTWKVPEYILESPAKFKYAFLSGLIDADGTISKVSHKNGLYISTGSKGGAESTCMILKSLGIDHSLYRIDKKKENKNWSDNFHVVIKRKRSVYTLLKNTEFFCPLKIKRQKEQLEYLKDIMVDIDNYNQAMQLRKQHGWGQNKIAKILNIAPSWVASWIYYNNKPRVMIQ